MQRASKAAFAAALCSLALPAASPAATKTVSMGPPSKPAGVPKDADVNQFFPSEIAVHAGDTLKFQFAGFHDAHFTKKGEAVPTSDVPEPSGATVAAAKDAAGADFWFNGQPLIAINPSLLQATKSGTAYDGSKAVDSALPLGAGKPKPWSVKLTKAGTYSFYCLLHPGMKGKVKVLPKSKPVPTAKQDKARVKAQLAKAAANLKKLDKTAPPAGNVIQAGEDLASGETLFRFTPAQKTVPVGVPVTLQMTAHTTEAHTFTFAKDASTLNTLAQGLIGPLPTGAIGFSPQAVYPSDAPLPAYDGNNHGDGFLNTGMLDTDARSRPGKSATVTFSAPGTYQYICLLHPEMHGTVVVQ